jgi:two-component system CheB/CheR fusion protein
LIVESLWKRWLLAVVLYAVATAANCALQPLAQGRIPWLPYFPALVLTGCGAGLLPALAVLLAAAGTVTTFWIQPFGVLWPVHQPADLFIVVLFLVAGGMVALVSSWSRWLLQQARENRHRLNMALRAGHMATWDWDIGTGAVKFSEGAQDIFGKTWTHVDEAWALGHPDDVAHVRATVEQALRSGQHYSFVNRMLRADTGELRWVQTHGHIHRDAQGSAVRVSGVTADVTDRQLALQASRAAEERFHLALESGKVTAWECDAERRYTWLYNTRLGLKPSDLIGRRIGETIPNHALVQALERVYAHGEPAQFQLEGRFQDEPYHLLCSAHVADRDAAGRVTRVVGASVDITELAAVQAQLRHESQRKDAFLATLAHELRNPMAPIRYAVAMLGEGVAPAVREQARAIISRQAAHMARLLDDLLDMSRITRNAIELQREVLDMRGIVEHALDGARPTYAQRRHRLTVSLPPQPLWVDGDATRLQQVLGNLLDNAAKYTLPGGEVTVRLDLDGGEVLVSVSDNGLGLEPEDQAQVFELFTQLHREGSSGGLGIGLAVVKQLVELHGGRIAVHSEGAGRGSSFTLRLPAAAAPQSEPPPAAAKVVTLFQRCPAVLVVDDNRDAADSLAALLRAAGYAASAVYDGTAALQAFDTLKPQVLLLDLGLPDMSGLDVARALRERPGGAALMLIAITGWGQEKDREQTRQAGFDMHLIKPVDPAQLQAVLREVGAASDAAMAALPPRSAG